MKVLLIRPFEWALGAKANTVIAVRHGDKGPLK